jgi:hypothetical protein
MSGFYTSGFSRQNHWSISYLSLPSSIPMISEPPSGLVPEELLNDAITSLLQLVPLDSSKETSSTFSDTPVHPSTTTNESVDRPWSACDKSEVNSCDSSGPSSQHRYFLGDLLGRQHVLTVCCVDCVCICASEFHLLTHQISLRCRECTWRDLSSLQEVVHLLSSKSRRTCPGQEKKSRLHLLHCPLPPGPFLNTLMVTAICTTQADADPTRMLTVSPTSDGNVWTLTLAAAAAAAAVRWIGRNVPSSIPMMPKPPSGQLPEELLNKAVTSSLPPLLLVPVCELWYRVTFVPSLLVLATSTSYSSYWLINKSSHEILPPINWTSNEDIIATFKGIDDAVRNLCSFQYYNNFHVLDVGELGSPSSSVVREILMIWICLEPVILTMIITVMVVSAYLWASCVLCPLIMKKSMKSVDDLTPRQRCLDFNSPSARREMQQQQQKKKRSGESRRAAVCRHHGLSVSLLSLLAICTSSQPLAVPMLLSAAIPLHSSRALTGTAGVY